MKEKRPIAISQSIPAQVLPANIARSKISLPNRLDFLRNAKSFKIILWMKTSIFTSFNNESLRFKIFFINNILLVEQLPIKKLIKNFYCYS